MRHGICASDFSIKKDYVRTQLYENNIDILTLQETELSPELQLENLQIKGYSIEVENNNKKRRVAIYIKNSISYKRRVDLEKENLHVIILDFESSPPVRIKTELFTLNVDVHPEKISESN